MQTLEMIEEVHTHRTPATATVGVIIPTYNAGPHWPELSASLELQGVSPDQILIIDSSSSDATRELARRSGYRVVRIPKEDFGHGATRQLAISHMPDAELLLFMTQDAILNDATSIEALCRSMQDPTVGAAYGRQIPRSNAGAIERHGRVFNYPSTSQTKSFQNRSELGIKAAFCSNSFAIYRRSALEGVGGFPSDVILGEDTYVAAKMLMAGWNIAYAADAVVIHSHDLELKEEFKRYFDTGVLHHRESWLLKTFGTAGNEGQRFVRSEFRYILASGSAWLLPVAVIRTVSKLVAYRLGSMEHKLPMFMKRALSLHSGYWPANAEIQPLSHKTEHSSK